MKQKGDSSDGEVLEGFRKRTRGQQWEFMLVAAGYSLPFLLFVLPHSSVVEFFGMRGVHNFDVLFLDNVHALVT